MRICLFCLFVVALCGFSPERGEEQIVRVMCYNVENYFDCVDDTLTKDEEYLPGGIRGWNYNRYERKQYHIAKVLVAAGSWNPPAIVGLCEIESRKGMFDLVKGPLKNLHYRFVHYESPDARGVDVALLYQPELFEKLYEKAIVVVLSDRSKNTTRDILYVAGRVPSGDTLHVFLCHFPSRLGGEAESAHLRIRAATCLRQKIDSVFMHHQRPKIIIMGDFNDYPDNASMQDVLRAKYPSEPYHKDSLYNLMFPLHEAGKGTHKHGAEWGALDQIIISGSLLDEREAFYTRTTDVHILNADFLLEDDTKYLGKKPFRTYTGMKYTGGFSDHLPAYLDLRCKQVNCKNIDVGEVK